MRSQSQQPLALSALRGVTRCRYQPRSDLRYEQAPLRNKHIWRDRTTKYEVCRLPWSSGRRKFPHVCALLAGTRRHIWFKWISFDVSVSATVHVDYRSAVIRLHHVLGDGLACVSLPFLLTTVGEYRDLQT